jgi:hypothetical protein
LAGHDRRTCGKINQKKRMLVRGDVRFPVRSVSSSKRGSLNKSFLSAEKQTPSRADPMTRSSSLNARRDNVRVTLNLSDSPPPLPVILEHAELQ